jgi:DNA-binding MarR family transcriptional regulator
MYNEEASKFDGTMSIGYVLLKIDPQVGTPSTALASMMGMVVTSLSRTLKNMEDRGLIFREPNPDDGRSVLIKLTTKGCEMREHSKEAVLKFNQTVREHISEEELRNFMKVSNTILDLINSRKIYI